MPPRPSARQSAIARHPLLLVHSCLDQARIDENPSSANKSGRDALRHHALENPAQGVALAKAFVRCAAEHRRVGDTVLDAELAELAIGKFTCTSAQNPHSLARFCDELLVLFGPYAILVCAPQSVITDCTFSWRRRAPACTLRDFPGHRAASRVPGSPRMSLSPAARRV
jgi:hypothetical protein